MDTTTAPHLPTDVGCRIKQAREIKGLTRLQLAREVGVSEGAIRANEEGRAAPSAETLVGLARVLGTRTDYLLGLESGR